MIETLYIFYLNCTQIPECQHVCRLCSRFDFTITTKKQHQLLKKL